MAYTLTESQRSAFQHDGYLVIHDFFEPEAMKDLQHDAQEVHDWHTDAFSPWMPYEEINAHGKRVLCRTENFVSSHSGFDALLRGAKLLRLLKQLSGEDMVLFKEKINYKLAGSGAWQQRTPYGVPS